MSTSTVLFLSVYGISLVAAVVFPPSGIWGYLFEYYNHPPLNWWGKPISGMFGGRWNFAIGSMMILGVVVRYGKYVKVAFFTHRQTVLITLYTMNAMLVTLLWANDVGESKGVVIEHLKMYLVYWCIVKSNSNIKYLHILVMVSILCCINWGVDTTFNPPSGRSLKIGAPALSDENFVAAQVVAIIPTAGMYFFSEKGWIKYTCLLGIPFMVNIIAHAASRGAFLALSTMAFLSLITSKGKMRIWVIVGIFAGAGVALQLFSDQFWTRQETMTNYEEDASAMGRIHAWQAAYELFKDNPFGYGGEGFETGLGEAAMAKNGHGYHTTHSMFFEILVSWGVFGVLLFYGFILQNVWDSYQMYKVFSKNGTQWPLSREAAISYAIFLGTCSMLVSSMFLNRYRWELWWIYAGICVALKNIANNDKSNRREESDGQA